MRRKVNNSETHKTEKYYRVPSEKLQEWTDSIQTLTKQRNQYKAERDTLIDDIAVLRANNKRLERENDNYHMWSIEADDKIKMLERENEQKTEIISLLNKESERHKDWEFEWHKKYNTLTNHIRLEKENNPSVSRYIDLVNYIDRLEREQ